MKLVLVAFLSFLCFCATTHLNNNSRNNENSGNNGYPKKAELVNLDQNCRDKIEEMLKNENGNNYKFYIAMRTIGSDTTIAYYQDLESKEIKNNSIWIYLDNKCNITGKKIGTIYKK